MNAHLKAWLKILTAAATAVLGVVTSGGKPAVAVGAGVIAGLTTAGAAYSADPRAPKPAP